MKPDSGIETAQPLRLAASASAIRARRFAAARGRAARRFMWYMWVTGASWK
jgi:hypothetical protein